MNKKKILATLVMLSLMQNSVYADGGVITKAHPNPGTYDSIKRFVTICDENKNDDLEEGLEINTGGDYEIVKGGTIELVKRAGDKTYTHEDLKEILAELLKEEFIKHINEKL